MLGTGMALLGWLLYAVAREARIRQVMQARRNNKAKNQGGGVTWVAQVAPVCSHRLLQGASCPLAETALKRAYVTVGASQPRSKLLYDLSGGAA